MKTLYTLNLAGLRQEAADRLKHPQGSQPFTDLEAALVGDALGRRLGRDLEHELIQAAAFEIDTLGIAPAAWILGWLSPLHPATVVAETIGVIALHLLGYLPLPASPSSSQRPGV